MRRLNRGSNGLRRKGFTLLETIITLMIVAIFLTGIAPGWQRLMLGTSLQMTADRLVQDIRELQQRALSEQCDKYYILFNRTSGVYYVRKTASPDLTLEVVHLPYTVAIESTNFDGDKLYISAKGIPWPRGGTITLYRKGTSRFKYVIVASVTGRVRCSDHPPESWEISP